MGTLYCLRADLEQLGIGAETIADKSDAYVDKHISAQSAIADGYIAASGKKLPLSSWGDDLRIAVAKMAAYEIMTEIGYSPEVPGNSIWETRYNQAMNWLKDIGAGRASNITMVEAAPVNTLADRIEAYSEPQRGW